MRKLALLATVVSLLPAVLLIGCSGASDEAGGTAKEEGARLEDEISRPGAGAAAPGAATAEEEFGP